MLVETSPSPSYFTPDPFIAAPQHPLIARISRFVTLGREECAAIESISTTRKIFRADQALVREGGRADCICLIMSGVAFRYRFLSNGRRQILGYLLPGDLCDTQFVISNETDHNVGLLCDTQVAVIALSALMTTMVNFPKIERALLMMSLIDAAMMREWMLNLGQRDASQKLAHFFCELSLRFESIANHDGGGGYNIPLTQIELADTMGLTVVHVNRVMQRFRRDGLLNWSRRHFDVVDYPRLQQLADFDPAYLRLDPERANPKMCAYG